MFLIIAFLFVFMFSTTTSPLFSQHMFWEGDSGLFQEMGICILQGGTPYVDLFDHKGPFLWYIQAFGIWISHNWGLMAVQVISLYFTILIWYKITQLLIERQILSIIIPIIGLIILLAFYERGNLCEEWSLPFISLPIYLYIKQVKKHKDVKDPIYSHKYAFIVGICVGILTMIRINNAAPLIGFVLWHFIYCIRQKGRRHFWIDAALIFGAVTLVFVSCSLFYLIKSGWNGVYEMIYGTFIFNFIYVGTGLHNDTLLQSFILPLSFLLISLFLCIFDKSNKNISKPLFISFVSTLLSVGTMGFKHYMITFTPLFLLTICLIIKTSKNKILMWIISIIIVSNTIILGYNSIDLLAFRLLGKQSETELKDGFHNFISSLSSIEQKSIYNYGLTHYESCLFAHENIYQCNRIVYKVHLKNSTHLQDHERMHGIKVMQPEWVLIQSPIPEATDDWLKVHYILADSINGGAFDPIWCWKKNDLSGYKQ